MGGSFYGGHMRGMDGVDQAIDLDRALDQLTGREVLAVTLSAQGHTRVEIAEVFHMTPQGVSHLIAVARKQIKKRMT